MASHAEKISRITKQLKERKSTAPLKFEEEGRFS